jgi:hypothetical protein
VAQDLVVKISANTKALKDAFKEAEKQTEGLKDTLSATAKGAGLAFAAFTGIIGGSIAAFRGQELAVEQLNVSLKNQGIFTEELSKKYQAQATALQNLTTFGDEQIIAAQATLQGFLGQAEVTEELTRATLDLAAAKKIDLASAAELVGKSVGTSTNALMRQGIEIDNTLKGQARLDEIVNKLNGRFGDQAAAAAKGSGAFLQLKNSVGDVFEAIGEQLVPVLAPLAARLKDIVNVIAANKELVGFAAKLLLAGAAISGVVAAAATLGVGFLKLKALMIALGGAVSVLKVGFMGLAGATGIGLLLVAIGLLAANWDESVNLIKATTRGLVKAMTDILGPLGNLLVGIFTLDLEKIKAGMSGALEAVKGGAKEFATIRQQQADAELAIESKKKQDEMALEEQQKAKFLEVKAQKDAEEVEKIKSQAERKIELEKQFQEQQMQSKAEFDFAVLNMDAQIEAQKTQAIRNEQLLRLEDEKRYGAELARSRAFFRSAEFKATQEGLGNLASLTATKNKELFAIGKAAAIASAIINTAAGATKALAQGGIIGPILAATVVAAGAVQIATIQSQTLGMAQGGLVTGGVPGVDSVPALLQRGELVAPRENFDEVVNSVARSRAGETGGGASEVVVELRPMGGFMDFIETQIIERRRLGIGLGV